MVPLFPATNFSNYYLVFFSDCLNNKVCQKRAVLQKLIKEKTEQV